MHNVPLLKEKNEFRGTLGYNDLQMAYAPLENFGLMTNAWLIDGSSLSEPFEYGSTRKYMFEGGVGYFRNIDDVFVFEVYSGTGLGHLSFGNTEDGMPDAYSASFNKIFVQPSFGLTNKYFDCAFSLRSSRLDFFNQDISDYMPDEFSSEDENLSILDQHKYSFLESGFTIRYGWKHVKFHMQLIKTYRLDNHDINFTEGLVNIGIHVNLAPRYRIHESVDIR